MQYDIIYIDPPWDYKGQTQHNGKLATGGATSHYSQLTLRQLKALEIEVLCAADCLMFLWVTSPHLDQGIELLKHWDFSYATIAFVWDKQRINPGFYTMSQCEVCVVGKLGRIPLPRGSRNERQLVSERRTVHSKKPDEVRERIQRMFPSQRKLEIFAREKHAGWDVFGDEVESDVSL